ncbi:MAG: hypothetical protein ABIP48_07145 [Planctomycetota bacterium]
MSRPALADQPTDAPGTGRHLDRVRSALAWHLSKRDGRLLEWLRVDRIQPRPYSTVVFLTARVDGQPMRLVSKTIAHHPDTRHVVEQENQAVVEYEMLSRLHTAFEHVEGCSVPRPLIVLPELETCVMEHVDGQPLADRLRYARRFSAKDELAMLADQFMLCGRWLAHFQHTSATHLADDCAAAALVERCRHLLDKIPNATGFGMSRAMRDRIMCDLGEQLDLLRGLRVPMTPHHSDFGPWNILALPGHVAVLDVLGCGQAPAPLDPIKMLLYLEAERHCLTSSARRVDRLAREFLRGFGRLPGAGRPLAVICESLYRISALAHPQCLVGRRRLHHRLECRLVLRSHSNWLAGGPKRRMLWPDSETAGQGQSTSQNQQCHPRASTNALNQRIQ